MKDSRRHSRSHCSLRRCRRRPGPRSRCASSLRSLPGGSLDFVTRTVSERLSAELGQSFVVENRAGANGNIGAEYVAKQPADGYVVLASADALLSSAHLYKLAFDPMKDLTPVIQLTRQPLVLAVHPSLGVSTLAGADRGCEEEARASAMRPPDRARASTWSANGSRKLAGIQLTHVPYKGGGQAITDLDRRPGADRLARLDAGDAALQGGQAQDRRAEHRGAHFVAAGGPHVPGVRRARSCSTSGSDSSSPRGRRREVVTRLNAAVAKVLAQPAMREHFAPQALDVAGGSAERVREALSRRLREVWEAREGARHPRRLRENRPMSVHPLISARAPIRCSRRRSTSPPRIASPCCTSWTKASTTTSPSPCPGTRIAT